MPAGFGPRHLRFADDGRTLVVVSEFQATLATFARDPETGRLGDAHVSARHPAVAELAQGHARPPAPAEPSVWAADLHLTPDERFAYVSERTSSRLLCYRRSEDGTFEPAHATATETQPRGFAIDPSGRWLVACGEQSEYVSVYAIAPDDGALSSHARVPGGRGANWVAIV